MLHKGGLPKVPRTPNSVPPPISLSCKRGGAAREEGLGFGTKFSWKISGPNA